MTIHPIARALFVAALACSFACADPGVTTPTSPGPISGTPLSLTVEADPTTIAHAGGTVHLTGVVAVEPGATVPLSVAVTIPGAQTPSMLPLGRDGRLDRYVFLATGGDLIVRAGEIERRIAIVQLAAPPPPQSPPPTCNGGPWPCPPPPELPQPPIPTPPIPTLVVTVTPLTVVRLNIDAAFSAAVVPWPGGAAIPAGSTYQWIVLDGFKATEYPVAPDPTFTYRWTHTGLGVAAVRVVTTDGRNGYGRVEFTVVP